MDPFSPSDPVKRALGDDIRGMPLRRLHPISGFKIRVVENATFQGPVIKAVRLGTDVPFAHHGSVRSHALASSWQTLADCR